MAISFIAAEDETSVGAVTSLTVTKPAGTIDGDVMILCYWKDDDAGTIGVTATGWTQIGGSGSHTYFYKVASSEPANYAPSTASARHAVAAILTFRGVETDAPIAAFSYGNEASTTSPTCPALSLDSGTYMIVAATEMNRGSETLTVPAGFTQAATGDTGGAGVEHTSAKIAYKALTGTSAAAVDYTASAAANAATAQIALATNGDAPAEVTICTLSAGGSLVSCVEVPDARAKVRHELDGPGNIVLQINRNSIYATEEILGNGLDDVRLVRVTFPEIDPSPLVAGFLETGNLALIDPQEQGGETVTFDGRGILSYLDFAAMWHTSYLDDNSVILGPGRRWLYTVSGGVITGRTSVNFATATSYACDLPVEELLWPTSPDQEKYNDSDNPRKYVDITAGPHTGKYVNEAWLAQPIANDGTWRLWAANTGGAPGQILRRIIAEAQAATHPAPAIPLLTIDFDYTNDSTGDPWDTSDTVDEFTAEVGESLLSVAQRLVATGSIVLEMTPDFVLHAYNPDRYGVDRTSATFGANKVRFVRAVNIADRLRRELTRGTVATHAIVAGDDDAYAVAELADAASRVTRHTFISAKGTDATALEAAGEADLAERLTRGEAATIQTNNRRTPPPTGKTAAEGYYLPGDAGTAKGDYWTGDTVTLDTGTDNHDYDDVDAQVAAITIHREDNNELAIWAELASVGGITLRTGGDRFTRGSSGGEANQARAIREALMAAEELSGLLDAVDALQSGSGVPIEQLETHHRFLITAHRGDIGSDDSYPENTLEGIRQAAIKGADRIEFDLKQSTDDTWWLMHDTTVTRTTDGTGTLSAMNDAAIAALNIDGGVGYNAGRHGTALDVPRLSTVLDALYPYDMTVYFHALQLTAAEHTSLAEYIVAQGWTSRAIVLVDSLTGAANVKAVSPLLRTSALTTVTSDPLGQASVDWWLALHTEATSLASVTVKAPAQVGVVIDVALIGTDEESWFRDAFRYGARDFMTNDLDAALRWRAFLPGAAEDVGRWEVVMAPGVTAPPEPVETVDGSDWVYGWVPG